MVCGNLKVIPVDSEEYATFIIRTFCMNLQVSIIQHNGLGELGYILLNSMPC